MMKRSFLPSIVDEFFGRDFLNNALNYEPGISMPAVNVTEGKEEFRIEVAAPGLEKDDFKVDINNNILTISSEKESREEANEEKIMRREFCYHSFRRSFSLPLSVDNERIAASHRNGVLQITLPKREEAKVKPARSIQIG
jgi:HSP20 family protein